MIDRLHEKAGERLYSLKAVDDAAAEDRVKILIVEAISQGDPMEAAELIDDLRGRKDKKVRRSAA